MSDDYEVCEKCYGTLSPAHRCGPETLAKDDLCPKCLTILADSSKAVFHYARDMLQIERLVRGDKSTPASIKIKLLTDLLEKREDRILKEMEDGRIKRT